MQVYDKTAPVNVEQFQELVNQFVETEGEERLAIASQLIDVLKKESWRITGELILKHHSLHGLAVSRLNVLEKKVAN